MNTRLKSVLYTIDFQRWLRTALLLSSFVTGGLALYFGEIDPRDLSEAFVFETYIVIFFSAVRAVVPPKDYAKSGSIFFGRLLALFAISGGMILLLSFGHILSISVLVSHMPEPGSGAYSENSMSWVVNQALAAEIFATILFFMRNKPLSERYVWEMADPLLRSVGLMLSMLVLSMLVSTEMAYGTAALMFGAGFLVFQVGTEAFLHFYFWPRFDKLEAEKPVTPEMVTAKIEARKLAKAEEEAEGQRQIEYYNNKRRERRAQKRHDKEKRKRGL